MGTFKKILFPLLVITHLAIRWAYADIFTEQEEQIGFHPATYGSVHVEEPKVPLMVNTSQEETEAQKAERRKAEVILAVAGF